MKTFYKPLALVALLSIGLTSCNKDKNEESTPDANEFKFVRVLVNDETGKQLSLVSPNTGAVESFEASFAKTTLYTTESGRYAAILSSANNSLQTFDSGLESHGDHIDVKGTAKFGALTGSSLKPTHFKSQGGEIITFNDGEGTLSIASESDVHTSGKKLETIKPNGAIAHHGAMARFTNGTYAITVKNPQGTATLPERVKIISRSGQDVHASTVETKGIHGNASNGTVAIFGSQSGVLVVNSTGTQRLISHPEAFGTAWLSSILEAKGVQKFIGYSAAKGAYEIDLNGNTLKAIIESTDILQCKVDYAGNNLVVLLHDGTLKVFDLANGSLKKEGKAISAVAKEDTQKPVLAATAAFAYITQPKSGEVIQVNLNTFATKKIKVSSTPYQLTILGYESNEGHN